MGAYHSSNPMISEPKIEASLSHYAWIQQENFFSASKIGSDPFWSASPLAEPTVITELETKHTKHKKKKSTAKNSNQIASKILRPKQPQSKPSAPRKIKRQSEPGTKVERKNLNAVSYESNLDLSGFPSPCCSCTGVARGCYKNGAGWQSSCCTTSISKYPLPMSSIRPGNRLCGRKMSSGAYGKLLRRLAAEGHDLSHSVDLKDHWARHGSNNFVTIK